MIKITKFLMPITSLLILCPLVLWAEVSITIYNQNLALVRESRSLEVIKGVSDIAFTDVAEHIIPTSVHFSAKGVTLLEQNYEFDLVESRKLLGKYIDHDIEVMTTDQSLFRGTLLSAGGDIVLRNEDNSITTLKDGFIDAINYPGLPGGLFTRPTLIWKVDATRSGKVDGDISYLTNGISWEAEYVAVIGKDEDNLELSGWVNIDNRTGATYEDAEIKLMAGDVNIERRGGRDKMALMVEEASFARAASTPQFEEESFYEYHLYTLQRKSTLKDNQIKQISLITPADVVKVEKEYLYEPRKSDKVEVTLKFKNDKNNHLEIPLPKGLIRVYKETDDGGEEFIGEDRIDHTPKNEDVSIETGKAFDIVAERKVVNTDRNGRIIDQDIEITLRNHKKETIEVIVREYSNGDWRILKASPDNWKKVDATHFEWQIKLKPEEERSILYTIQTL